MENYICWSEIGSGVKNQAAHLTKNYQEYPAPEVTQNVEQKITAQIQILQRKVRKYKLVLTNNDCNGLQFLLQSFAANFLNLLQQEVNCNSV